VTASRADVEELVAALDHEAPLSYDLGTPELFEVEPVRRLVDLGQAVVPQLLEHVTIQEPKLRTAYVVMALGLIGDERALEPLRELCDRYRARPAKDELDYAVLAQCGDAIGRLDGGE
jgi:HEAT repeat protein